MSCGTFVAVWTRDGDTVSVVVDEEPRISAAVSQHIESGGTRDGVLDMTLVNGAVFCVRASEVTSWAISTPESRAAQRAWEAALDEEEETNKRARGWTEDES